MFLISHTRGSKAVVTPRVTNACGEFMVRGAQAEASQEQMGHSPQGDKDTPVLLCPHLGTGQLPGMGLRSYSTWQHTCIPGPHLTVLPAHLDST